MIDITYGMKHEDIISSESDIITPVHNPQFKQALTDIQDSTVIYKNIAQITMVYKGEFQADKPSASVYGGSVDSVKPALKAVDDSVELFYVRMFDAWVSINAKYALNMKAVDDSYRMSIASTTSYLKVLRMDETYRRFLAKYLLMLKVSRDYLNEKNTVELAKQLSKLPQGRLTSESFASFYSSLRRIGLPLS